MSPILSLVAGTPLRKVVSSVTLLVLAIVLIIGVILGTSVGERTLDFSLMQKISATAPLRLGFPEAMNQSSVEQYLILPEDLDTEKEWVNGALILKPRSRLEMDRTYIVEVDGRAETAEGAALGRTLKYTFEVAGAPIVSASLPVADSVSVPTDAEVLMVFDRPVVPLTQVQGGNSLFANWPVKISPQVHGRWRWLGTTTAAFETEKGLQIATKYTVTVPPGIETISGDQTEKDFSWSFETPRPEVTGTSPAQGSASAGPTTEIALTFNQEIDLIKAKETIRVEENEKEIPVQTVRYQVRDVNGKKVTDKKTIVATPSSPLRFQKKYRVIVLKNTRGLVGDLGTRSDFTLTFETVGPFRVLKADYQGSIHLFLSSPFSGTLEKHLTITPPPKEKLDLTDVSSYESYYENRRAHLLSLHPRLEPSTKYTVKIAKGLKDIYGQEIVEPFEFSFTTPPLSPNVFVHPPWKDFAVFERGKPPIFYINKVNVSSVNVELAALPFGAFIALQNERNTSGRSGPVSLQAIASEYKSLSLKPKAKKDLWESMPLDTEKEFGGKLAPGIYGLVVRAPEWLDSEGRSRYEERFFEVTNLGVTLKYSYGRALVWVIDLQTGSPVSGATVKFHALKGTVPVTLTTDKDGFADTKLPLAEFKNRSYDYQPEFWVTVEKDGDFAFVGSNWNSGTSPHDFDGVFSDFRSPDAEAYRVESFVYTDRPLYRAGDTVHFKGMVRFLDRDGHYAIPSASRSILVSIDDPTGKEIYKKTVRLTEYGSFTDTLTIPGEASLGSYYLRGQIVPETDTAGYMSGSFSVLAYRKPEYAIDIVPETQDYFAGDTAKVEVHGNYYFGAPMSDAPVEWRLMTQDYYFNKYTEAWYSFALENRWCYGRCETSEGLVTEGKGTLDSAGKLSVSFPAKISEKGQSQVMSFQADILDKNNQVVSGAESVIAHAAKVYVGIRSDNYSVQKGGEVPIQVITLKPDGSPAPGQKVDLKLYSRTWNVLREQGVDGEYYYESEPKDTFIRTVSVITDEKGKGTANLKLLEGGEYRVIAETRDTGGRTAQAGWSVYAYSETYFNWPRSNNDKLEIVADKPEYKTGDTAKLLVKSPYQGKGVKALVTVERENIMKKWVVDVPSNALPIEVPITEELIPNAYVSVTVIKPRIGETFNENGLDTGAPAYKMGYVRLSVDTSSKKLSVKIIPNKERYLPRETVSVRLETVDAKGAPVPAELSLAVVDMSLIDLAGFRVPDLVERFYGERGLGVVTANMLQYLTERFKPGSKGGGGGGETSETRGNFLDTAYWKASVVTDINGIANTEFTLPDNLTTWQLLALGSTKQHLFGGFATTIIETKNVILRPVRPRFAVVGDKATLGAIVHNELSERKTFTVTLQGTGFTPTGTTKHEIQLEAGASSKVLFPVRVDDAETVTMHFTARTEGAEDSIRETIPVFPFGVAQAIATEGVTETEETEVVSVPTKKDAPTGELSVKVAPTLAVHLPDALEFLAAFPYECVEQTISRFIGNLALVKLEKAGRPVGIERTRSDDQIRADLQKAYSFQRSDGGFGYWVGSSRSYVPLTAYIVYAFRLAQEAGYSVDATVLSRSLDYLSRHLKSSDPLSPSTRAQVLFTLSEFGREETAILGTAYKERATLPLYAKSYLAMALKNAKSGDARAEEVLNEIMNLARVEARGAHFEERGDHSIYESMNTDMRTTAIALQAASRIDPAHVLLPRIVRGMLASRHDGHWDTTQSTAYAILGFLDYVAATGELEYDLKATVEVAGKKLIDQELKSPAKKEMHEATKSLDALGRGKDIEVKISKTGKGRLYYDLLLSYFYAPETIDPIEQGIGILRETEPLTREDSPMKVGTTHKVRLTITVPETRHFVAVESMLPAGFEAIDLQYATSQQHLEGTVNVAKSWQDEMRNQLWRFTHIEFRDDRIFLFADELPAGVYRYEYLVRATTPGTFRTRPAKVWEMYFPEVFGQTDGGWLKIGE